MLNSYILDKSILQIWWKLPKLHKYKHLNYENEFGCLHGMKIVVLNEFLLIFVSCKLVVNYLKYIIVVWDEY
jgi:hypothetical protein